MVTPALTVNAAESRGTNPECVAVMTYWPGGTSGNATWPAPSVRLLAMTRPPLGARSSTCTPGMWTVPSSVVIVTATRPVIGRLDLLGRLCGVNDGCARKRAEKRTRGRSGCR